MRWRLWQGGSVSRPVKGRVLWQQCCHQNPILGLDPPSWVQLEWHQEGTGLSGPIRTVKTYHCSLAQESPPLAGCSSGATASAGGGDRYDWAVKEWT